MIRRSQGFSAAANWLAFAGTLAVSFVLTPYLIRQLGPARYDVWCSAEAVLAYFTLLDLGVAACLVRYVAKHHATAQVDSLNRMASTALLVFSLAGLVALVLGVAVFGLIARPLSERVGDPEDVLIFLALMLANLALTLPLSVFPAILDGLERYPEKSLVRILVLALRTGAIIGLLSQQVSLVRLGLVLFAATMLEHALIMRLCWRFLPALKFRWHLVDRETWRQVRTFSTDAFLAMLAGRITLQTGTLVAGLLLPTGAVTVLVTATRLVEYAKTLLRTVTATLTPGISAREAQGDWPGIRALYLQATRWMLYLVVPIHLGLIWFGWPFLARWVGPELATPAYPLVVIVATTLTLGVLQSVASRLLYGLGQLRWFARMALLEALLNVGLLIVLVGPWQLSGIAWAIAGPNILFCGWVLAHTMTLLKLSWSDYLAACVIPLSLSLIPAIIWTMLPNAEPTWLLLARSIGIGLVPYVLAVAAVEADGLSLFRRRLRGRPAAATPAHPSQHGHAHP